MRLRLPRRIAEAETAEETEMKRVTAGLAVLVLLAGGFYVLIYSIVSSDNARTEMVNAITRWSLGECVDLTLLPAPSVSLYDLKISDPDAKRQTDILSADRVNAEIRILPLLIGRIGFRTLEVINPKIFLIRTMKGKKDWRFDGSSAAVQLALTGNLPVERLTVKDGLIEVQNIAGAQPGIIGLPEFLIEWKSLSGPAIMRGSISRDNDAFAFNVRIASDLRRLERLALGGLNTISDVVQQGDGPAPKR